MPAQRRVPIEAGGGEARLAAGELMRRTKVRSVEREGAILRLGGWAAAIRGGNPIVWEGNEPVDGSPFDLQRGLEHTPSLLDRSKRPNSLAFHFCQCP